MSSTQGDSLELGDASLLKKWSERFSFMTGIGLTEEQKAEKQREKEKFIESYENQTCRKMRDQLMKNSPIVIFILEHLEKSGCPFSKKHLKCVPCDVSRSGGFSPEDGILLCQNRLFSRSHMEDTLAHELIHAYDHCKYKVDWTNPDHHACTEIRAASLSGDCKWSREIKRGNFNFTRQHQECVKRRALLSLKQNPFFGDQEAKEAVDRVFENCFKDTAPFDEIY